MEKKECGVVVDVEEADNDIEHDPDSSEQPRAAAGKENNISSLPLSSEPSNDTRAFGGMPSLQQCRRRKNPTKKDRLKGKDDAGSIEKFLEMGDGKGSVKEEVSRPGKKLNLKKKRTFHISVPKNAFSEEYYSAGSVAADKTEDVPDRRFRPEPCRKKSERQNIPGYECPCCKGYYDTLSLSPTSRKNRVDWISRHRAKVSPPKTPENFWEPLMPTTQECLRKGLIHDETRYVARKNNKRCNISNKDV